MEIKALAIAEDLDQNGIARDQQHLAFLGGAGRPHHPHHLAQPHGLYSLQKQELTADRRDGAVTMFGESHKSSA
jgi:hypothetical protein